MAKHPLDIATTLRQHTKARLLEHNYQAIPLDITTTQMKYSKARLLEHNYRALRLDITTLLTPRGDSKARLVAHNIGVTDTERLIMRMRMKTV